MSVILKLFRVFSKYLKLEQHNCLFELLVLAVSLTMQIMLVVIFISGALYTYNSDLFIDNGRYFFRPELETYIYLGLSGIFIGMSLLIGSWFIKCKMIPDRSVPHQPLFFTDLIIAVGMLVLMLFNVWLIVFSKLLFGQPSGDLSIGTIIDMRLTILLFPPVLTIIYYILRLLRTGKFQKITIAPDFFSPPKSILKFRFWEIVMMAIIFLLVYRGGFAQLTGQIFLRDGFWHWDGFIIRPALALIHGQILGRDTFIQYGIGWPLVYAFLNNFVPISYKLILNVSLLYAGFYQLGIYLLLRKLVNRGWAVWGTLLMIFLQFYLKSFPTLMIYPNSSLLRAPLDVWFFLLLCIWLKKSRKIWFYALSAVAGLAIVFEFDTGMYLLAVLFLIIINNLQELRVKTAQAFFQFGGLGAIVISIFGLSIYRAAGSHIFNKSYWQGLFEGIYLYSRGVSPLPFSMASFSSIILFTAVVSLYLFLIGLYYLHGSTKRSFTLKLLSAISLYGLGRMLIFVSRTHIANILQPLFPFWIITTYLFFLFHNFLLQLAKSNPPVIQGFTRQIPKFMSLGLVFLILMSDSGGIYPHSLMKSTANPTTTNDCLLKNIPDVCGLSPVNQKVISQYLLVTEKINKLMGSGKQVAVFDDWDSIIALGTDSYPVFRYRPVDIMTKKQLEDVKTQLLVMRPEYVVIRQAPKVRPDAWNGMVSVLAKYYQLTEQVDIYQIWSKNR